MKVTTLLRTTAQIKGMIDELKAKRQLLNKKLETGSVSVVDDVLKLESDINTIDFGLDIVDEYTEAEACS